MRSVPSSRPEKAATRGCGTTLGAQSGIAALSYCQCAGGDGSKGATEGGRGRAARDARAGRGTAGGKTGSARDKSKVEISESIVVDGALKPAEFGSGHSGPSRKSLGPGGLHWQPGAGVLPTRSDSISNSNSNAQV